MQDKTMVRRAIAGALAACYVSAQAATTSSESYTTDFLYDTAYLVDWNAADRTAAVTTKDGRGDADVADDGLQRIATLRTPIVTSEDDFDVCGQAITRITALQQLVFRRVTGGARHGTARVVEIGTITAVGGCAPGSTPYGAPTDEGTGMRVVDLAQRASIADLVPGATLAGMSETPSATPMPYGADLVDQVVTFGAGSVRFADTGDVVPTSVVDGWIVLDFGGFQRAYTRIALDATSGAETWLYAPWANGAPTAVDTQMMVKPTAAAGFGTRKQTAHDWFEAIFKRSGSDIDFQLYRDLTGAKVTTEPANQLTASEPVAWQTTANETRITRTLDNGYVYLRRWIPLSNVGANHFVMESEDLFDPDGNLVAPYIHARVNYYADHGPAREPAADRATHAVDPTPGRGQPTAARP